MEMRMISRVVDVLDFQALNYIALYFAILHYISLQSEVVTDGGRSAGYGQTRPETRHLRYDHADHVSNPSL